jgi:hypothetical protein
LSKYATRAGAQAAGLAVKERLAGRGWKVRVWENLGWHWALHKGPLQIYPAAYRSGRGLLTALCAAAWPDPGGHPSGGSSRWFLKKGRRDPNAVVRDQVKECRKYIEDEVAELTEFLRRLEEEFPEHAAKPKSK